MACGEVTGLLTRLSRGATPRSKDIPSYLCKIGSIHRGNKMKQLPFVIAFAVASVAAPIAHAGESIDICSVRLDGNRAIGEDVAFVGKVVSDGMHSTRVFPERCSQAGYSMAPDDHDDSPTAIIRQTIMRVGAPGTTDKGITIDVRATIVRLTNGELGIKITKLRQLVLTYESGGGRVGL